MFKRLRFAWGYIIGKPSIHFNITKDNDGEFVTQVHSMVGSENTKDILITTAVALSEHLKSEDEAIKAVRDLLGR